MRRWAVTSPWPKVARSPLGASHPWYALRTSDSNIPNAKKKTIHLAADPSRLCDGSWERVQFRRGIGAEVKEEEEVVVGPLRRRTTKTVGVEVRRNWTRSCEPLHWLCRASRSYSGNRLR